MRTKLAVVTAVVGLFVTVGAATLSAHHAFAAEFDAKKPVRLDRYRRSVRTTPGWAECKTVTVRLGSEALNNSSSATRRSACDVLLARFVRLLALKGGDVTLWHDGDCAAEMSKASSNGAEYG